MDLEATLRAVEPGWRFVKVRHLAQAHRYFRDHDRRLPPSSSASLRLSKVEAEASGCFPASVFADAPPEMLFAPSPVDSGSRAQQLSQFWKVLFSVRLSTANAGTVWRALPPFLRREIEIVLKSSDLVLPDATDAELGDAFAIDLLTRARFASEALKYRYPGLANWAEWRGKLCEGIDEAEVFRTSRPVGAAEPGERPTISETVAAAAPKDATKSRKLEARARETMLKKSTVRTAILFAAATQAGGSDYRYEADIALREMLVEPLAKLLGWNREQESAWVTALHTLLVPATRGYWSPAAKALYDLQTVAVDLGGELYAVDPAAWVGSFGRRPLLRKLTLSRLALLHQRLLKVKKHIAGALLPTADHAALLSLLDPEIHAADVALRAAMEPVLHQVLSESGLRPDDIVERIALPKIVDELLDLTVAQGFFRFGDLRDVLARNQLKVPDLAGPGEFLFGDALLKANAGLGAALDGIYYPAEVYLRWFHRGSAVAFGTKIGRWLTRFAALPFGAAFMTVEFAKYIAHEAAAVAGFLGGLFVPITNAEPHAEKHGGIALSPESLAIMVALGILYLGLIHSTAMRGYALAALAAIGGGIRWLFAELPSNVWNSPPLKAVRRNRFVRWFRRRLAVPTAGAGLAAVAASAADWPADIELSVIAGSFALLALAVNTPAGQSVREGIGDAFAWCWRQVRTNFIPGLFGWIIWLFHELLAGLDRLIYSIDEWFRFRDGQAKPSLAIKVALGMIWFPVRYALRFAIYLLIEPQINPIKHFPVVTVSHKLLLPMIPAVTTATGIAEQWVALVFAGVPGVFGFLAWELKENWRLYAANRPPRLVPLALGHHGESVRGLLRPGFHSGTVPKAFASIRKALGKAEETGTVARFQKALDGLHHVEHAVQHFAERDLLAYLSASRAWAGVPLRCRTVHLGVRHIAVEIAGHGPSAHLRFELIDSSVVGHCDDAAFLTATTPEQRECWERAVLGFWAMGAVPMDDPRVEWREWVRFWESKCD